jgi:hypothetical protein
MLIGGNQQGSIRLFFIESSNGREFNQEKMVFGYPKIS